MEALPLMALPTLNIDPKAYQQVRLAMEQFRLAHVYPRLALGLQSINIARPTALDCKVFTAIKAEIDSITARLETSPFPPGPASILGQGPITAGFQAWDGTRIGLTPDELSRHVLIPGMTGAAKTSYQWYLALNARAALPKLRFIVFDPKGDGLWWAAQNEDCLIFYPNTRVLAPLQRPAFLTEGEFLTLFVNTWASATYGGQTQKTLAMETLQAAFNRHKHPSLNEWQTIIKDANTPKLPYAEREALHGAAGRIERFNAALPGIANAKEGIPYDDLFTKHSLYFAIKAFSEGIEWLLLYLISLLLLYKRERNERGGLTHLILIDEGMLSYNTANKIDGTPLLSLVHSMTREFGIGIIVTTTSLRIDPTLKANTYTYAGMTVTGEDLNEVTRLFHLDRVQAQYMLRNHERGQVLLQFADRYRYPLLATFPPPTYDKNVTPQALQHAIERTDNHMGPPPTITVPIEQPTAEATGLRLTATQRQLLQNILTGPLRPTTKIYNDADLPYQVGDRCKALLLKTGLITSTIVTIRARQGGRAIILTGTKAGYALLGLDPPKRSRGGAIQHSYYCQELSRHITNASQEVALNTNDSTKCADIVFRYQPALHEWLPRFLAASASTPDGSEPTLLDDALVAIEVEISEPATSSVNNATKNANAGIDLTIIAVQRADRDAVRAALQQHLPSDHWPRVAITSLLPLLDTVRPGEPT